MYKRCITTKKCHEPGSNRRHLDLQSNALPTELSWLRKVQRGAVEACWAHNPEVGGSKPLAAILIRKFF
uniref:Uncharacterized protein n=1 Tax=Strongyloides venezuelensis TaxID=75913 RepID=A0A0K0G5V9_STRVS